MILVDTSVWVDHLRSGNDRLKDLLLSELVLMHVFVLGELACGNLKHRDRVLQELAALPTAVLAQHDEVLRLVGDRKLCGKGIGWVDGHLLTSALLSGCRLWTLDKPLSRAASACGISA